jgi:DNA-binding NtrC family response regulator
MLAYPWPGNVRELKNLVDRACIFCDGENLSPELLGIPAATPDTRLRSTREEAERERIIEALRLNQRQMQKTAEALGVSRKTLWEKMKRLRIDKDRL